MEVTLTVREEEPIAIMVVFESVLREEDLEDAVLLILDLGLALRLDPSVCLFLQDLYAELLFSDVLSDQDKLILLVILRVPNYGKNLMILAIAFDRLQLRSFEMNCLTFPLFSANFVKIEPQDAF